MGSDARQLGR